MRRTYMFTVCQTVVCEPVGDATHGGLRWSCYEALRDYLCCPRDTSGSRGRKF